MSIINEALQKAGEINKTGSGSPAQNLIKNISEPPVKSKKISKYKWFYVTSIIILLFFAILRLLPREKIPSKGNIILPPAIATTKPEIIQENTHKIISDNIASIIPAKLPDISEFKLAGIVLGEGAPIAIINDSVYMAGDMIKDLKIVQITKNSVLLEKDGEKIELRVQ
jgi:hypothetical protein